jgi:hypothetical protein
MMTNDTRSPAEIERDIERERAGLSHTLEDLQDKFSVEGVVRQVSDQFREHGGDFGRSVTDAVKRNPIGLALTGVGLAWLMFGDSTGNRGSHDPRYSRRDLDDGAADQYSRRSTLPNHAAPPRQSLSRNLGPQPGDPTKPYYAGRYSNQDDVPSWARTEDDDSGSGIGTNLRDGAAKAGEGVSNAASSAEDATRNAATSTADAARKTGSSVAGTARDAAGAVSDAGRSTMDGARNLAASASDRAAAMRTRLAEGTESLSEEARNRVVAARERAVEARHAASRYGRQGRDRAVDMFEEHPLIAGALAVAVGAAIGAALPRSRTEDQYLGEHSDNLMAEAERIYEDEKSKLGKVAKAATDEAKTIANETKANADEAAPADTAAQAAVDKAKSSGQRIADAAEDEAKKQKLGDVSKS